MGITSVIARFKAENMKMSMNAAMKTTLSSLICRNYVATTDASASIVPIVSSATQLNTNMSDRLAGLNLIKKDVSQVHRLIAPVH